MTNSQKLLLGGVLAGSIFMSGCNLVAQPANVVTENPIVNLSGVVSGTGTSFFINVGGKMTEITSRKLDLNLYKGKTVTVTGEYSGTTLYVDGVK